MEPLSLFTVIVSVIVGFIFGRLNVQTLSAKIKAELESELDGFRSRADALLLAPVKATTESDKLIAECELRRLHAEASQAEFLAVKMGNQVSLTFQAIKSND